MDRTTIFYRKKLEKLIRTHLGVYWKLKIFFGGGAFFMADTVVVLPWHAHLFETISWVWGGWKGPLSWQQLAQNLNVSLIYQKSKYIHINNCQLCRQQYNIIAIGTVPRALQQPEWGREGGVRHLTARYHVTWASRFNVTWGSEMMWRKRAVAVRLKNKNIVKF